MSALSSAGSRIVLMGTQKCANDTAAPPVPSVESTMDDLADVMVSRCGADPDNIVRVQDAADPMRMGIAVAEAAEEATDVLLVHYVGHGFPGPDGELYLATRATDPNPNRLQHNSLRWDTIRKSLLNSRARTLVVILDCCFSGRAAERTLNAAEPVDLADVQGGYILTAGAREQLALAPKGQRHTAFTGELIRLLRDGDPESPAELRMRHVYRALDRRLRARSLPPPFQRNIDQAEDLVLAANTSDGTGPSTGARRIAAPPKRRRLLPTLVITAVVLVALAAGLWLGVSVLPRVWSTSPSPGNQPQPQAPSPLPLPTACAKRSIHDNCGKLPGGATALDADRDLVSLVGSSKATALRYKQSSAQQPVTDKTDLAGDVAVDVEVEPVVVPDARGRLVGFAIGDDGRLRYNPNIESGPAQNAWPPLGDMPDLTGKPAVAQDHDGRLVVVVRHGDGTLWRFTQLEGGTDKWSGAKPLRGPRVKDDPTIHQDSNGALRVFALAADGTAHTWAQKRPDSEHWPDQQVGTSKLATSPAVAKDGDGRLHLFARGTDDCLYHFTEESKVNIWTEGWQKVGLPGPYDGDPFAVTDRAGTVTAFIERKDPPEQVAYTSVGGSRQDAGKSANLERPMARILSATIDRDGALVVQGLHDSEVVSAYRKPADQVGHG